MAKRSLLAERPSYIYSKSVTPNIQILFSRRLVVVLVPSHHKVLSKNKDADIQFVCNGEISILNCTLKFFSSLFLDRAR